MCFASKWTLIKSLKNKLDKSPNCRYFFVKSGTSGTGVILGVRIVQFSLKKASALNFFWTTFYLSKTHLLHWPLSHKLKAIERMYRDCV